jgi:hypothetical protein
MLSCMLNLYRADRFTRTLDILDNLRDKMRKQNESLTDTMATRERIHEELKAVECRL